MANGEFITIGRVERPGLTIYTATTIKGETPEEVTDRHLEEGALEALAVFQGREQEGTLRNGDAIYVSEKGLLVKEVGVKNQ